MRYEHLDAVTTKVIFTYSDERMQNELVLTEGGSDAVVITGDPDTIIDLLNEAVEVVETYSGEAPPLRPVPKEVLIRENLLVCPHCGVYDQIRELVNLQREDPITFQQAKEEEERDHLHTTSGRFLWDTAEGGIYHCAACESLVTLPDLPMESA